MISKHQKRDIAGLVMVSLALVGCPFWMWYSPTSNTRLAKVSWSTGGTAHTGLFRVHDLQGRPVVGAKIQGWNSSGFSEGTTNSQGEVRIEFGEPELIAVDVDGSVLDRPGLLDRTPYVFEGLIMDIRLKRP